MLKDFINSINNLESEARKYYAGQIGYSREEFVKILVIDGCFIIDLFFRNSFKGFREENDPIFSMSSLLAVLDHDLILLENQVPWMVLEHLFNMSLKHICQKTLIEIAIEFFGNIFPFRPFEHLQDIKHIPDLFKKLLVPSIDEVDTLGKRIEYRWEFVPSATRLVEAGIKFKKSTSKNLFDIKFTNGVLEIPTIKIHEITETFFRNIISYEHCYPNSDDRITSYAILLDNLIDTAKDVEILCEKEILFICLNPEDAAQFFNKLYHNTCVKNFYFGELCREINGYCQKRRHRWRAVLMRNYFNTPWAIISTLAAFILLWFSFLQTVYTMKS